MTRVLRGAVAAAFLVLLATVPASAHAELEESDPADGATITTPYTVTATFSEEFDPNLRRSFMRVVDASGDLVAEGGQSPDDPTVMTVELPTLEAGAYTVQWQTTTPDDNGVVRDTFTFNVAQAATATPSLAPTPRATASAEVPTVRPTAVPTTAPTPGPTPTGGGEPTASGSDILLALALAAVVLVGLGAYLFTRSRR